MIQYLGESTPVLTPWEDGLPWLRMDAVKYIESHLYETARVFEWGCGGSTIWFARNKYIVRSSELDYGWAQRVRERLVSESLFPNVCLVDYAPASEENIQRYIDSILHEPDNYFDLVLVDGRYRVDCMHNVANKVVPGGMVCLDNSNRFYYRKGMKLFSTWNGVSWGNPKWMTTIWRKPE